MSMISADNRGLRLATRYAVLGLIAIKIVLLELERCGVDQVVVLPFDARLARQAPQDFIEDVLVRFGHCCNPVPGDPIVGFITRGRGVTVHLRDCPKALDLDPARLVEGSPSPEQHVRNLYTDDTGRFFGGIWRSVCQRLHRRPPDSLS